jgi:FkbM family methyltransferase
MIGHQLKRASQTPRAFSNWLPVLRDMLSAQYGKGPAELTFRTRDGLQISCPNVPGARVPIYEIYAEDCYDLTWFLGPLLQRPIRVLDIGAHVGAFACQLAKLNPQARIECFEPATSTADYLRRNAQQNGFTDRITADERAVAAEAGWADFSDNEGGSALNSLVTGSSVSGSSHSVETTTFDAIVGATETPVDVVKMDCEGGEYDAVLASTPASWDGVTRIVLEYHPSSTHKWAELRDWFAGIGFTVMREEASDTEQGTAWLGRQ